MGGLLPPVQLLHVCDAEALKPAAQLEGYIPSEVLSKAGVQLLYRGHVQVVVVVVADDNKVNVGQVGGLHAQRALDCPPAHPRYGVNNAADASIK